MDQRWALIGDHLTVTFAEFLNHFYPRKHAMRHGHLYIGDYQTTGNRK